MFVGFVGFLVREGGLEPPIPKRELDPKSSAFANFATLALMILIFCKRDIKKQVSAHPRIPKKQNGHKRKFPIQK